MEKNTTTAARYRSTRIREDVMKRIHTLRIKLMRYIADSPHLHEAWGGKNLTLSDVLSLALDKIEQLTGETL